MQDPRISKSYGLARFQPPSGRAALAALRDSDASEWSDDIMKEVLTSNAESSHFDTKAKVTPPTYPKVTAFRTGSDAGTETGTSPVGPTNRFFGRFMGPTNRSQKRFEAPKEESPKPTFETKSDFPPTRPVDPPTDRTPVVEQKRSAQVEPSQPTTWSLPRSRFYTQSVMDEPPQRVAVEPVSLPRSETKKPAGFVEAMVADIASSPWLQDEPYRSLFTRVIYALQKKPYPKEYVPFFNEESYMTSDSFCKFEGSDIHLQVGLAGLIKTSPLVYPFGRTPADAVGSFSDQDLTLGYILPSGATAQLGARLMRHDGVYVLVPNVAHKFNEIHLPTTFSYRGPLQR